jgi:hypothetical protein
MKRGRVGGVEAEEAELEGENQRGPSRRGRCEGGGEGRSEGAESEGENERGRVGGVEAECAKSKKA